MNNEYFFMEEVIKYFESLEARLTALEEAQKANAEKLQSNEAKLLAIGERITAMMAILKEAKAAPQQTPVVEQPKPVVEEKPIPVVAAPELIAEEPKPVIEEPKPMPEPVKEQVSPNAALYGKAVDDIRQAISLGDRFLYQRELFGQKAELMQPPLTELNELSSFDEALAYIRRFNWDTESSTYQQFLITLHRRFG